MGFGLRGKYQRAKKEATIRFANSFGYPRNHLKAVYSQPTDMCEPDRLMLYALVRGLRPERVLEIGVRWGGGAKIISAALEDSGFGKAVGIDPQTQAFRAAPADLFNRYTLLNGYSPAEIPNAVATLGGKIDLAFIDAMHTHDHVLADFNGVVPYMSLGGHVLLHDTFHVGINQAIEEVLKANLSFVDCGFLTRYPQVWSSSPVAYNGLRLIRTGTPANHDTMRAALRMEGKIASLSPEMINWDYVNSSPKQPATSDRAGRD